MVVSISKGLGNSVCGHRRRISRLDNIGQHLDRQKFRLWRPPQDFRQINTTYIAFIVWGLHGTEPPRPGLGNLKPLILETTVTGSHCTRIDNIPDST